MVTKEFINTMKETYPDEVQILLAEFFIIFSRFECALKESGFVSVDQVNFKVSANWEAFVASIRNDFEASAKSIQTQDAIELLANNPPRIQIYSGGQLGWQERQFDPHLPLINKLCCSIRDIRNNLFHGGKFNGRFHEDVSRNTNLLFSGIEILNHWLQLSQTVRENFLAPLDG